MHPEAAAAEIILLLKPFRVGLTRACTLKRPRIRVAERIFNGRAIVPCCMLHPPHVLCINNFTNTYAYVRACRHIRVTSVQKRLERMVEARVDLVDQDVRLVEREKVSPCLCLHPSMYVSTYV